MTLSQYIRNVNIHILLSVVLADFQLELLNLTLCRHTFNAAENDTLLYCRVMRWADIPMLIINNIKLKTIFFITYSTLKVPSTSVICMRSKAFNISRFCFNVLVLSQLKKIRICCDSALPNSTLT